MKAFIKNNLCIVIPSILLIILTALRCFYTYITGYFVPDEGVYYILTANYFRTGVFQFGYSTRLPMQIFVFVVSWIFGLTSIRRYFLVFPWFFMIASILTLYFFKKILNVAKLEEKYTVLMIACCPIFFLISILCLTESFALMWATIGIYYFLKEEYGHSCLGFFACVLIREQYLVFLFGNFVYLLYKKHRKAIHFLVSGIIGFVLSSLNTIYQFIGDIQGLKYVERGYVLIRPPPVYIGYAEGDVLLETISWIKNSLKNVFVGLFGALGIVALFVIIGFAISFWHLREKKNFSLCYQSCMGIFISLFSIIWKSRWECYLTGKESAIIRFSFSALQGILLCGFLYTYFPRTKKILLIVGLSSLVVLGTIFPLIMQSGLSSNLLNRLDFAYRSPYVKAEKVLSGISSTILIVGEPLDGLMVWIDQPNVDLRVPPAVSTVYSDHEEREIAIFEEMISQYDRVFLYGGKRPAHYLNLGRVPWYVEIVEGKSEKYFIETIWEDKESYFYEVIKNEA